MLNFFNARFWGVLTVIGAAAAFRLVPHPPNFSPLAAMALFGGATLTRRELAFAVPLAAMFLSDLVLGFHDQMVIVYISIALVSGIGLWLRSGGSKGKGYRSAARIGVGSIAGSLIFFTLTNFAVWFSGGMYEKSLAGLWTCYTAALPFFQATLMGDLFFSAMFFGAWVIAEKTVPALGLEATATAVGTTGAD